MKQLDWTTATIAALVVAAMGCAGKLDPDQAYWTNDMLSSAEPSGRAAPDGDAGTPARAAAPTMNDVGDAGADPDSGPSGEPAGWAAAQAGAGGSPGWTAAHAGVDGGASWSGSTLAGASGAGGMWQVAGGAPQRPPAAGGGDERLLAAGNAGLDPAAAAGSADASCDFSGLVRSKCGNASCHGTPAAGSGLDLTSASAGTRLAGRKGATACTDKLLINPDDPADSLLYLKVSGTSCGAQMPLGGSLTTAEQACVLAWIEAL